MHIYLNLGYGVAETLVLEGTSVRNSFQKTRQILELGSQFHALGIYSSVFIYIPCIFSVYFQPLHSEENRETSNKVEWPWEGQRRLTLGIFRCSGSSVFFLFELLDFLFIHPVNANTRWASDGAPT